jgi:hypothetical protein
MLFRVGIAEERERADKGGRGEWSEKSFLRRTISRKKMAWAAVKARVRKGKESVGGTAECGCPGTSGER